MMGETANGDEPEILGVGVNRRRVIPISGPSLVRHVVVWLPTGQSGDSGSTRAALIDEAITSIYIALRTDRSTKQIFNTNSWNVPDGSITLFNRVISANHPYESKLLGSPKLHRAIKFWFEFKSVPITFAFDLHEEMASLTMVLDCSDRLSEEAEAHRFPRRLRQAFDSLDARSHVDTVDIQAASNELFFDTWGELDKIVFKDVEVWPQNRILLDGRGVILGADRISSGGPSAKAEPDLPNLKKAFSQSKTTEQAAPARIPTESAPLDPTRMSRLLPLLTCRTDSTVEYTLSLLMGKRALYASCLGSGPDSIDSASPTPITYLLLADAYNSWQLGRLVYRIHRAGGARVAATKYFEVLRDRAEQLRDVEHSLEEALSTASLSKAARSGEIEDSRDTALQSYEEMEAKLDETLDYGRHEALSYRINRSRYYVTQFKRASKAMRIERVEGFQPYNEYVEQRQGSAFEFLNLLGIRYERLQSDRSLLLRRIQVFNAQISEDEINSAQWTADAALFVVLGPYYAAHVIVEIAHPLLGGQHSVATRSVWFGLLMFGVAFFVARRKPKKSRSLRERIVSLWRSKKTIALLAVAAAVTAVFYHFS